MAENNKGMKLAREMELFRHFHHKTVINLLSNTFSLCRFNSKWHLCEDRKRLDVICLSPGGGLSRMVYHSKLVMADH